MLVVYEDSDVSTFNFLKFCQKHNYDFVALNVRDMVSDRFKIIDTNNSCVWKVDDKEFDLASLSGLYLRTFNFNDNLFLDYRKDDQNYVKKEWWSYFVYRTSRITNCINPVTLELLSSSVGELPFFLDIASEVGFKVPKYTFSPSYKELEDIFYRDDTKYLVQFSLNPTTDFRAAGSLPENALGLVKHIKGMPIFVHIVDNDVYTCKYEKSKKITLDLEQSEIEKCLQVCRKAHLRAAQIILIKEEGSQDLFFISLSAYPNWNLNSDENVEKIFNSLASSLGLLQKT